MGWKFWDKSDSSYGSQMHAVAGGACPKCGGYGLFYYGRGVSETHPEPFALCESCLTTFDLDKNSKPITSPK